MALSRVLFALPLFEVNEEDGMLLGEGLHRRREGAGQRAGPRPPHLVEEGIL